MSVRPPGATTTARTASRSGSPDARPAKSWNHRSLSFHGTAAFAGDVDGRTNRRVSPSIRSCRPSAGRSLNVPRYASFPTNATQPGFSSRAICSSRSAEPAKSARRRSLEPGVVRGAAFVTPIPSSSSANCSLGAYSRDVNLAAWSSRQKSLRGFAKCARAASEKRPGLIPTKMTRKFGPRTSGTALRSFSVGVVRPRVDERFEPAPQVLARNRKVVPRPSRLPRHDLHRRLPTAVAADITLGLGERAQTDDEPQRTSRPGRHLCDDAAVPVKPRELRFAVDLGPGGELLDEHAVRLDVPPEWTPEHLLLAALVRCSLASFTYHAKRAGLEVGSASGSARG